MGRLPWYISFLSYKDELIFFSMLNEYLCWRDLGVVSTGILARENKSLLRISKSWVSSNFFFPNFSMQLFYSICVCLCFHFYNLTVEIDLYLVALYMFFRIISYCLHRDWDCVRVLGLKLSSDILVFIRQMICCNSIYMLEIDFVNQN